MKLTHPRFGETRVDSEQEARRLAQYGWRRAPEKAPAKRSKQVEKPAEEQPELPVEEPSNLTSE